MYFSHVIRRNTDQLSRSFRVALYLSLSSLTASTPWQIMRQLYNYSPCSIQLLKIVNKWSAISGSKSLTGPHENYTGTGTLSSCLCMSC